MAVGNTLSDSTLPLRPHGSRRYTVVLVHCRSTPSASTLPWRPCDCWQYTVLLVHCRLVYCSGRCSFDSKLSVSTLSADAVTCCRKFLPLAVLFSVTGSVRGLCDGGMGLLLASLGVCVCKDFVTEVSTTVGCAVQRHWESGCPW